MRVLMLERLQLQISQINAPASIFYSVYFRSEKDKNSYVE
jgi:hypothetical protein